MLQTAINLKKINTTNIFQQFLDNEALTKQDLVTSLGLTLPTINKNIDYLLDKGLICATGSRGKTGGRNAITYAVVADAQIALGLDVTRHHVCIVAVDLRGHIIAFVRKRLPFKHSENYFQKVGNFLERFIENEGLEAERIVGVGIGVPALVSADNKKIFYSQIIPGLTEDCFEMFQKYIPFRISMYNDAKAAAYAERWRNTALKNVFYILLSNNVGGAMIIDGKVYSGNGFRSSEVGHMTLVPGGRKCYCGQQGCSDAYLAATNLSADDLEGFFAELRKGKNPDVEAMWSEYLDDLAVMVKNVNVLLDCDVVIGGYVGAYMEPYIEELRIRTAELGTFERAGDYIRLCSYKKESIAAGAALHFVAESIDSI